MTLMNKDAILMGGDVSVDGRKLSSSNRPDTDR